MKCHRCGGDFPRKKGTFCGTCPKPSVSDTLADVLVDLLAHNHHQFVGGQAWAQDAVNRIRAAQEAS